MRVYAYVYLYVTLPLVPSKTVFSVFASGVVYGNEPFDGVPPEKPDVPAFVIAFAQVAVVS